MVHRHLPMTRRSAPSRAVESFAQQIRVAVVPGVLLDHVDIDPAQVHVDLPLRMEEGLIQGPAAGRFPGTFNLPHEGGEILLRIGFIDVIELPVGISLARVEEAGVFSRDAATATTRAPPPPYDGRVPAATGSTAQPSAAEAVRQSGHCTCSTVPGLSGSQATALAQQCLAVKIQPP